MSGIDLEKVAQRINDEVRQEVLARAYPASNELRSSADYVLRGQRTGRQYKIPNTKRTYTASAPGEPPAVRTGALRASWRVSPASKMQGEGLTVRPSIESVIPYVKYLEPQFGNGQPPKKVFPRPFADRIRERALPNIEKIYKRPYLGE